ncbi:MAG: hypothetical protein ABSE93_10320 [Terriglobia bacterium]
MWERRTYHECADELGVISQQFRSAQTNALGWDNSERNRIMHSTSERGVELLRTLASSIRSDQDYGLINSDPAAVGALRSRATEKEVKAIISEYRPPYSRLNGFEPLGLRQALNKIVHADPTRSSFFATDQIHDLILTGVNRATRWIAVISVIDLCRVIKALPDVKIRK